MRFALLLTTGVLAVATPVLAQTGTAPATQTSPTTSPTPSPSSTATPTGTAGAATATGAPVDAATAPQIVTPAVGVTVYDPAGTVVGTIKSMDAQFVTLQTANGPVRLPLTGVGPGPKGALIGLSAAELNAQVAQAAAAQAATTGSAQSTTDSSADAKATTQSSKATTHRATRKARHHR